MGPRFFPVGYNIPQTPGVSASSSMERSKCTNNPTLGRDTSSWVMVEVGSWGLIPFLATFQLYCGGQFYWWRK